MNHCFVPCKHRALKSAARKRQLCCSFSNTKADSKGSRYEKRISWVTLAPLEGFRSTFGLNFKVFLGEHAPTLPYNTVYYMRTDNCVLQELHQLPSLYVCPLPSPSSISGSTSASPVLLVMRSQTPTFCVRVWLLGTTSLLGLTVSTENSYFDTSHSY